MVNKIIKNIRNNESRILKLFLFLLSFVAIAPFYYLARYNVPGASDDLFHGFNLIDKSYFDAVFSWYKSGYNGRFANAFFMLLPNRPFLLPLFGQIFPIVIFSFLIFSLSFLIKSISPKIKWSNLLLYALILMVYILGYTPSISQFYWYSGMTVYIIPAIFYIFLIGIFIQNFNNPMSIFKIVLIVLLTFGIVGSNENWMLLNLITVSAFLLNSILAKEKILMSTYFLFGWTLLCVSLMLFAPGTTHRISAEGNTIQNAELFPSLFLAIFQLGNFIFEWFISSGFFIIGIFFILKQKSAKKEIKLFSSLSNTFIIILLMLVVYIGIFILLYSLGHFSPLRIRGITPNFFVALFLILLVFSRIAASRFILSLNFSVSKNVRLLILLIGIIFSISNSTNIKNAYIDIYSGAAKKQASETKWIINYIKTSAKQNLRIPQVPKRSKILYSFQLSENKKSWLHWVLVTYFHKTEILIAKNISFEDFMNRTQTSSISNTENNKNDKIYKKHPFSNTFIFPVKDIYNATDSTILVSGKILVARMNPENSLVFQLKHDFRKAINITDLVKKEGVIDSFTYKLKLLEPLDVTQNDFKVYLYNPTNDTIEIMDFKVELAK